MEDNRKFGFKKSTIDGTELVFGTAEQLTSPIPDRFDLRGTLPEVLDQGSLPICVPCSLSAYLNWKIAIDDGVVKDQNVDLLSIFNGNNLNGEGMTFKEAFSVVRHNGVDTNAGVKKIGHYGVVRSHLALKYALIMNGPCFGALPVYSYYYDFWNKKYDDEFLGYHAIAIVGYDENGFIIRNSWGKSFGDYGYTKITYEDFNKFIELWTVID